MDRKNISELRQDLVTGDWVVVAPARAKRPNGTEKKKEEAPKSPCPFDDPQKSGNEQVILAVREDGSFEEKGIPKDWIIQVIPNKYPAFSQDQTLVSPQEGSDKASIKNACVIQEQEGPYHWVPGYGYHEVIIYRDHERSPALFTPREGEAMFRTLQKRYLAIKEDACIKYITLLHNHGSEAGASVRHPHSQLMAIPVVPPDILRSLEGSKHYFGHHNKCVHCVIIEWEIRDKKRILFENEHFIAFFPYVSRASFEVRIFPKKHNPRFEFLEDQLLPSLSEVLRTALRSLYDALGNPPYNMFVHTSPANTEHYDHYHWHMEIIPKTSIWAGFEIGTGIEIATIAPEDAAAYLKSSGKIS